MEHSDPHIFTYEEALDTFTRVRELTSAAVVQVQSMYSRVQSQEELERRREELDSASRQVVEEWMLEVESLGCEVKGLWLVDWDMGSGYYCWRWPEEALSHYHDYEEGFAGRVPLQ